MNSFYANSLLIPIGLGSSLLLYLSSDGKSIFSENGTYHSQISFMLLLSFIYFFLDFILMVKKYEPKNKMFLIHHLCGILSIIMIQFKYYYCVKYMLSFLTYELSTPLLNISLSKRNKKISNLFTKIIDILFLITYTMVRIIFGSVMMWNIVPDILRLKYPINLTIVFPLTVQMLNYWWFIKIIKMLIKTKKN